MRNIGLKVFSLAVAILLSVFVNSETNSSVISFFVPVEVKNMPVDKVIVSPSSRQVQISIRGPSFLVSRIAASPSPFRVRIPGDVQDRFLATLQKSDLALPPDVQLVGIDPSEIEFRFDELSERDVPVVIPKIGNVGDGVRLDDIHVVPDKVRISGPRGETTQVRAIESEPLDLHGGTENFVTDLNLRVPSGLIQAAVGQVHVAVKIVPLQVQRRFEGMVLEVRAAAGDKWLLSPQKVDVEVSGPKGLINGLKPSDVIAYSRPSGDSAGEQSLQVGVDAPAGVTVTVVHPSVVVARRAHESNLSHKPRG